MKRLKKSNPYRKSLWHEKNDMLEHGKWILLYIIGSLLLAYLFYDELLVSIVFLIGFYPYVRYLDKVMLRKKKLKYIVSFREFLFLFEGELSSGESLENALYAIYGRLAREDNENFVVRDLKEVCKSMDLSIPFEVEFMKIAKVRDIDHVILFVEVLSLGRKTGENLRTISKRTVDSITNELICNEKEREILSEKKLESNIMSFMPAGILLYVRLTNPSYISMLYRNQIGIIIMSLSLFIYVVVVILSLVIIEIGINERRNYG